MRHAWVIYNPYAGRFPAGPLLKRAAGVLDRAGWKIRVVESHAGQDLTALASEAVDLGCDAVFVAGGDGSVGRVAGALAGTKTALAVLPAGTANVWAKELGLPQLGWITPLALEEAARRLAHGQIRVVDIATCDGTPFLLWAGVGLDGKVVNSIEPRERWEKAFAVAHYAMSAVWESLDWTGMDLRVTANGQTWSDHFLLAVASNIRAYAGGFLELSPEAKLDDGLLDVWLLPGRSIRDAISIAVQILMGRHIDSPEVVYFQSSEVTIEADSSLPMHLDGEPQHVGQRALLSVQRRMLKVLVPEGGWPDASNSLEPPITNAADVLE
ncbi:MAG: diacylglycerol kinase family protein [Anaerolineales bacterium]